MTTKEKRAAQERDGASGETGQLEDRRHSLGLACLPSSELRAEARTIASMLAALPRDEEHAQERRQLGAELHAVESAVAALKVASGGTSRRRKAAERPEVYRVVTGQRHFSRLDDVG